MRLKDLITYLQFRDEDAIATNGFGAPHSYRGYYEQVAFKPVKKTTAGEMLKHAKAALGNTFTGWKGGEFTMHERSFVNIAEDGGCGDDDEITVQRLDEMFGSKLQRQWVGLTDKEVRQMCGSVPSMREAVREAEAILKEKNT